MVEVLRGLLVMVVVIVVELVGKQQLGLVVGIEEVGLKALEGQWSYQAEMSKEVVNWL